MEKWVNPVTEVQQFAANEYVAACYWVTCEAPGRDLRFGWNSRFPVGDQCNEGPHQIAVNENASVKAVYYESIGGAIGGFLGRPSGVAIGNHVIMGTNPTDFAKYIKNNGVEIEDHPLRS